MSLLANLLLSLLLWATPAWAAVDFDGADDGINFGSAASLDDAWYTAYFDVQIDAQGDSTAARLMAKAISGGPNIFFESGVSSPSDIDFDHDTGGTQFQCRTSTDVAWGTRNRILVKWDRSLTAASCEIFINGTEAAYQTLQNGTVGLNSDAASDLCIGNTEGASGCGETRSLDGVIYEFAFWSIELTDAEAAALTDSNRRVRLGPTQVQPASLLLYSTLDDEEGGSSADGDTFFDRSGNGNNGAGTDGTNNTGLTVVDERQLSYP